MQTFILIGFYLESYICNYNLLIHNFVTLHNVQREGVCKLLFFHPCRKIDSIFVTSCSANSPSSIELRFVKSPAPKLHPAPKFQKFDELPNSLGSHERAIVGVKIKVGDFQQHSSNFIVCLTWKINGNVQQHCVEIVADLSTIFSGNSSLHPSGELFISDLAIINAFQFQADLCFKSIYTDLNNVISVMTECDEFVFATKSTEHILFSQTGQFPDDKVLITFRILESSCSKSVVRIYTRYDIYISIFPEFIYYLILCQQLSWHQVLLTPDIKFHQHNIHNLVTHWHESYMATARP